MNSVGTGEQFQRPAWVCTKAVPSTRSCVRAYPRAFCSGVPSSVTQRHTHGESEGMVHHSDRSADGAPVRIARSPPETVDGMYCSSARAVERLIVLELCHAAFEQARRYHHARRRSRVRRDGCECVSTNQKRETSTGAVGASTHCKDPITIQTQAVQVRERRDHDDAAAPKKHSPCTRDRAPQNWVRLDHEMHMSRPSLR